MKDKVMVFIRRRKLELKGRIAEVKITMCAYTIRFNTEATRRLGVYLATELQFRAHNNLNLEKVKKVKDRVRRLAVTKGLAPGLVR